MKALIASLALACAAPAAEAQAIKGLNASGPHAPFAQRMQTFGQFVGDWDLEIENQSEDGTWVRLKGEWSFGWILGGRAVQDVWVAYEPEAGAFEPLGYGTTVRVYDAQEDLWRVTWMGVLNHNYTMFKAREVGKEVILDGSGDAGEDVQWVFYDITERFFRWRAQDSSDGGQTWTVRQRMVAHRRA